MSDVEVTPSSSGQNCGSLSDAAASNWLTKVTRSGSKSGFRSTAKSSLRGTATRAKRFGPYSRTPSDSRKLHTPYSARRPTSHVVSGRHGNASVVAEAASELDLTYLRGLVNKTWRVHRTSPMYKFSTTSSSLRSYSRQLSAHVESASLNKLVGVGENADLARIKPLKLTTADKSQILNGVEIELLERPKQGNGAASVVLTAVLCSIDDCSADVTLGGLDSEFTCLPLMLIKGPVKLRDVLFTWWQSQFDCCISLMNMSPVELSWMVAMFSGFVPEGRARDVELVYKLPAEVTALTRITYRINAHDCQQIWLSIHSGDEDSFCADEVVSFIHALEEHFYQHFRIKLAALQLSRVGTSIVCVSDDGGLKMYSAEHVLQILSHVHCVVREPMSTTE